MEMENEKYKGIFFNYNEIIKEDFFDTIKKKVRTLNYKVLTHYGQSIHHVNIYIKKGVLKDIRIKFRPEGIKPEDIDLEYLMRKPESHRTSYENLLMGIAEYHHKIRTGEVPVIKNKKWVCNELKILRNKIYKKAKGTTKADIVDELDRIIEEIYK